MRPARAPALPLCLPQLPSGAGTAPGRSSSLSTQSFALLAQSHQLLGDPCPPCPPAEICADARQAPDACFGDFLIGEIKDGAHSSPIVWGLIFPTEGANAAEVGGYWSGLPACPCVDFHFSTIVYRCSCNT